MLVCEWDFTEITNPAMIAIFFLPQLYSGTDLVRLLGNGHGILICTVLKIQLLISTRGVFSSGARVQMENVTRRGQFFKYYGG